MADLMKMGKNPNYLGSWDIEELPNREVTLTIEKIVDEEVVSNGQKEICTVCYWSNNAYKKMILNVCNKKTICKLYKTKDTEKLRGKSVIIGIERVKAFGDVYEALRIRPRVPQVQTAAAPKCESCGKDITASGSMSPDKVAAYTKKKYGKCLCGECATAIAQQGAKE
jgi:hypothetical protein